MLRLLSLILLLAGAGIIALGGWLFAGNEVPVDILGMKQAKLERTVIEPEPEAAPPAPAPVEPFIAPASAPPAPAPVVAAPPPPPPPPPAAVMAPPPAEAVVSAPRAPIVTGSSSKTIAADVEEVIEETLPTTAEVSPPKTRALAPPVETASAPAPASDDVVFGIETTTPTISSEPAVFQTIEQQLYSVPIAYETPRSASFNLPFTVTLSINAQEGAETATGGLPGIENASVGEATVQVTDLVKANLVDVGDAFTIDAENEKPQKLSGSTESVWRWKVTPIKSGPQKLTFEIFAVHPGDIEERLRTFEDTVTVEVSRIGQAMFLAQQYNPIVVILAGIGSLLAGLFGAARFFRGS